MSTRVSSSTSSHISGESEYDSDDKSWAYAPPKLPAAHAPPLPSKLPAAHAPPSDVSARSTSPPPVSGIGRELLKKLGWREGEVIGAGFNPDARSDPIIPDWRNPRDRTGVGPSPGQRQRGGTTNTGFVRATPDMSVPAVPLPIFGAQPSDSAVIIEPQSPDGRDDVRRQRAPTTIDCKEMLRVASDYTIVAETHVGPVGRHSPGGCPSESIAFKNLVGRRVRIIVDELSDWGICVLSKMRESNAIVSSMELISSSSVPFDTVIFVAAAVPQLNELAIHTYNTCRDAMVFLRLCPELQCCQLTSMSCEFGSDGCGQTHWARAFADTLSTRTSPVHLQLRGFCMACTNALLNVSAAAADAPVSEIYLKRKLVETAEQPKEVPQLVAELRAQLAIHEVVGRVSVRRSLPLHSQSSSRFTVLALSGVRVQLDVLLPVLTQLTQLLELRLSDVLVWHDDAIDRWSPAVNTTQVQRAVAGLSHLRALILHSSEIAMELRWVAAMQNLQELSVLGPVLPTERVDLSRMALRKLALDDWSARLVQFDTSRWRLLRCVDVPLFQYVPARPIELRGRVTSSAAMIAPDVDWSELELASLDIQNDVDRVVTHVLVCTCLLAVYGFVLFV